MLKIPRYDLGFQEEDPTIQADGEWCKWEDVQAALEQREREIGEAEAWVRLMLTQAAEIGRNITVNKPFDKAK